jgi:glucose-1-phosphate adenylyltransferase
MSVGLRNTRPLSRDVRYTLALILAGGRGERLHGLTKWRVKPAVPFGGKYRIIDFALSNCLNSGIRQIAVLTQYKSQSLIRHIARGWGFLQPELGEFVEVLPAQQRLAEKWYSGTADAVYQNIDIVRRYNPEFILVLAGDHVYRMDYAALIAFHREHRADMTVACYRVPAETAPRYGVMGAGEDYSVRSFYEKPECPEVLPEDPSKALVSMGIYVFAAEYLFEKLLLDAETDGSNHDFGADLIPRAVVQDDVCAYPFNVLDPEFGSYWRDIGTVDSYWEASMDLVGVRPELNLYDHSWPIRTAVDQLAPAKFVFSDPDRTGSAVDSLVSEGCIISGGHVARSLISTNVRIEEATSVEESVVLPDVVIGSGCRIRKAIIDKGCIIPSGTEIGIDPSRDWSHLYVSPGGVGVVTPEALGTPVHRVA